MPDYAAMNQRHDETVSSLVQSWQKYRDEYIHSLVSAVDAASGDVTQLAAVSVEPSGAAAQAFYDILQPFADAEFSAALDEARRAGHVAEAAIREATLNAVASRAHAVETMLVRGLSVSAARSAVQHAGDGDGVATDLTGLSDAFATDNLSGAVSMTRNEARMDAMDVAYPSGTTFYASELMDHRTCVVCEAWNGHDFASLEDAVSQYPSGGNQDCLGGVKCRGTIVAVDPREGSRVGSDSV